jgi:hypothetical protein
MSKSGNNRLLTDSGFILLSCGTGYRLKEIIIVIIMIEREDEGDVRKMEQRKEDQWRFCKEEEWRTRGC